MPDHLANKASESRQLVDGGETKSGEFLVSRKNHPSSLFPIAIAMSGHLKSIDFFPLPRNPT